MSESASFVNAIICPVCGGTNSGSANFCEQCGTELRALPSSSDAGAAGAPVGGIDPSGAPTLRVKPEELVAALTASTQPIRRHSVACKTDIGHSHHVNQDAGGAWSWTRPDGMPASLLVVADGVSAGRFSEDASKLAVEILAEQLSPRLQQQDETVDTLLPALLDAAKEANRQVSKRPHQSMSSADATTLVATVCIGGEGGGVWCGDSRVYLFSRDRITRLTRDHSWAEGVVSHGIMSAEEAARDPRAHMITRWLGPPEQDDPGLEAFRFRLNPEDVVMCCTDGLYMYFSPPASQETEILRTLRIHGVDLQGALDELVDEALRRGGRDNITVSALQAWSDGGEPGARANAEETMRFTSPREGATTEE